MISTQLLAISLIGTMLSPGQNLESSGLLAFTKITMGRLWIGCPEGELEHLSKAFTQLASLPYRELRKMCVEYLDNGSDTNRPYSCVDSEFERSLRALKAVNIGVVTRLKYRVLFESDQSLNSRFGNCWILGFGDLWSRADDGSSQLRQCEIRQYDPAWVGSGPDAIKELDFCEWKAKEMFHR